MLEALGISGFLEGFAAFMTVIIVIGIFAAFWCLVCYLIKAFTVFELAKRANAPRAWFAFIPILQNMKIYNFAGFSEKACLAFWGLFFAIGFIPVQEILIVSSLAQIALTVYIRVQTAKNFGGGVCAQVLNAIFEPFVLIYFALSNKQFTKTPIWEPLEQLLHELSLDTNFGENVETKQSQPIDIEIEKK